ncbi:hypothetical protein CEW89_15380 [Celeribacter ethanolicus]|uniref:Uncharacterized protein n=1 Tax=Celeribacter ethanolicus TaxID=1758178 RepID=A0A291GF90_9RHOB|nr:recombinase family protein [Celeribacter ethanolicus]ATG48828.1 hypothetical protein CEW89_15380 [Celeribacter ethanolicus]
MPERHPRNTPEGRFAETIFAAQGELEREHNRHQTLQKMRARIEKGYWVFSAAIAISAVVSMANF